jgi:hypothetical protein
LISINIVRLVILLLTLKSATTSAQELTNKNQYTIRSKEILITKERIILQSGVELNDEKIGANYQADQGIISDNKFFLEKVALKLKNAQIKAKIIGGEKNKFYFGEKITASLCNTCDKGKYHTPLWQIRAEKLYTNLHEQGDIQLKDVYIDIFNKQIIKLPWLSVPALWTKGKTGFLLPKVQYTATSGLELSLPFYWMPYQNFDLIIQPKISTKPIYNLIARHKFLTGGYNIAIITGKPLFVGEKQNSIWSTIFKGNSNFFTADNVNNSSYTRGFELGARGAIAFGNQALLLEEETFNPYKAMIAEFYYTKVSNQSLIEGKFLQLQDRLNNKKQIILPKLDIINLNKIFNDRVTFLQSLSIEQLSDDSLNVKPLDLLLENKLLITNNFLGHQILYQPKLVTFLNAKEKIFDPRLTIEWQYKNFDKIIPQISVNLASKDNFYQEAIYTVNNPFKAQPHQSLFTQNLRSIHITSKAYLDYGATIYTNTFSSLSLLRRDYLDKNRRQDMRPMQSKSDNYALQWNIVDKNLLIQNKSWFTNDLKLSNNELYFRKAFQRFKAGFNYFFFDKELHFINQKMENHLIRTQLQYQITDQVSFSFKNSFLMNDENNLDFIKYRYNKFELKFKNDCAEIALAVKQFISNNKANSAESVYQIHFKIPQLL